MVKGLYSRLHQHNGNDDLSSVDYFCICTFVYWNFVDVECCGDEKHHQCDPAKIDALTIFPGALWIMSEHETKCYPEFLAHLFLRV